MFVFVADLHLSPLIWASMPAVRGDAYVAWRQIIQYCQARSPSALILGGDIFDKLRPDSESVDAFAAGVSSLRPDMPILAIQGQHDRATPAWPGACTHGRVTLLSNGDNHVVVDDKKVVTFRGYDQTSATVLRQQLEDDAAGEPYDVLVLHQLARQFVPFDGAWDFDADWVPSFVKLVLAGDYHEPVNDGKLWYPGSTHARSIGEFGDRSFMSVRCEDDGFKVTRVPLQSRKWHTITVLSDDDFDAQVAELPEPSTDVPEEIAQPVVVARYNTELSNIGKRLEDACAAAGCILRAVPLAANTESASLVSEELSDVTLEGCLSQVVDREKDAKFHAFMLSLLTAPDVREALASTRSQLGL